MAYSEEALAFSTIPTKDQVRLEDRVSYLYLEYCQVRQDRTGVIARQRGDYPSDSPKRIRIQLPVAGLGVLMLGPGTSISQPAATSCARAGTAILYCGGGGFQLIAWRRRSRRRPGGRSPRHGWWLMRLTSGRPLSFFIGNSWALRSCLLMRP